YALANAVENLLRMEAVDEAASSAEHALALANTIGDPVALSQARANLGLVFAKRGEWAKAEEHLLGSVEIINRLDNPYSLATRYEDLARLYDAQGRGGPRILRGLQGWESGRTSSSGGLSSSSWRCSSALS